MTMTLGQPLRRYREHAGYTQKDVARLMMVTPQAVSKWENDAGTPDISLLRPIAKLFGITHRHLAGRAYTRPRRHSALIKSHTSDDYVAEYDELRALCRENPDRPEILLRLLGCIAEWLSHARDALSRDQQTALSRTLRTMPPGSTTARGTAGWPPSIWPSACGIWLNVRSPIFQTIATLPPGCEAMLPISATITRRAVRSLRSQPPIRSCGCSGILSELHRTITRSVSTGRCLQPSEQFMACCTRWIARRRWWIFSAARRFALPNRPPK